ncbi:hypothetical protein GCM10023259_069560 [Thermocatellispora tengchongensis]
MPETRCDRCDLPMGLGCSCSGPAAFAPHEILISPNRYAHLPEGCDHTAAPDVMASEWGRVPRPPAWTVDVHRAGESRAGRGREPEQGRRTAMR